MNVNDIEDVLNVTTILSVNGAADQAHQPYLIAALIDWKNGTGIPDDLSAVNQGGDTTVADKPKAKRGKATESDDSESRVTPDPSSDEPDF